MLYHLLYPLHVSHSVFNVFRYQTFRTLIAALTSLIVSFLLGPWVIRRLTARQIGQTIRPDGPQSHLAKAGTPTMGGTLILFSLIFATLMLADLTNFYVWLIVGVTIGFATIGFIDDYGKLRRGNARGLSGRAKLAAQVGVALVAALALYLKPDFSTDVGVPVLQGAAPEPRCVVRALCGLRRRRHLERRQPDRRPRRPGDRSGDDHRVHLRRVRLRHRQREARRVSADPVRRRAPASWRSSAAPCCAPASGSCGSTPIRRRCSWATSARCRSARRLALVALVTKQEIVMVIAGGVFVVEALSVIFQVASFKLRRKRVFRMAPIHHHFELQGWPEPQIIVRFWIVSIICAVLALSHVEAAMTMKIADQRCPGDRCRQDRPQRGRSSSAAAVPRSVSSTARRQRWRARRFLPVSTRAPGDDADDLLERIDLVVPSPGVARVARRAAPRRRARHSDPQRDRAGVALPDLPDPGDHRHQRQEHDDGAAR